jgi:protein farnesyltransferase/geranylgeranyltransferase type-1 subunit alpha
MTMMKVEDLDSVFADVTPIPQDDGPHPVCAIDYNDDFIQAYDYMRAILKADEQSDRALELTALCLQFNPANYTVWHFRRKCLANNSTSDEVLEPELELASRLGGSNPKNYQIWYHRRAMLEAYGLQMYMARKELNYVASVLSEDAKNYHAWTHRQWILRTVDSEDFWKAELEFSHKLIIQDVRNNSAWNQRWFASHRGLQKPLDADNAQKEADYAINGAKLDPYNESPWRYLIGLVREEPSLAPKYETKAAELRQVLVNANRDADTCANLTSARIDLLEMMGDDESLKQAIDLAQGLATKHDVIRTKYWMLRASEMEAALQS